jgi:dTMP kinase
MMPVPASRTGPPARPGRRGRPPRISIEGLNGTGKTAAARAAARALGPGCVLLEELTDSAAGTLPAQVIAALAATHDPFLRTGHPAAETLALLALKVRESEQASQALPEGTWLILEDRGIDTVAVYQAAILTAGQPLADSARLASWIRELAQAWCPRPDHTVLLRDDVDVCTARFADRPGIALSDEDHRLIARIDQLYATFARMFPQAYTVLDITGRDHDQSAAMLASACARLAPGSGGRPCAT